MRVFWLQYFLRSLSLSLCLVYVFRHFFRASHHFTVTCVLCELFQTSQKRENIRIAHSYSLIFTKIPFSSTEITIYVKFLLQSPWNCNEKLKLSWVNWLKSFILCCWWKLIGFTKQFSTVFTINSNAPSSIIKWLSTMIMCVNCFSITKSHKICLVIWFI